ncbi:MAG: hypothetical protein OQK58_06275, partial [Gammaproteobacteria bacterium]|nr:hypothetical protein [Gammaproteobacteria bacterium]
MNYNSFLTRDYKLLGQPPAPQKRPPFTRLHAVIVIAAIMFIITLASFFSNNVEATRNIQQPQLIQLNEQTLSQIHTSLTTHHSKEDKFQPIPLNENVSQEQEQQIEVSPVLKQTMIKIKSGHSLSAIFRKHHFSQQDLYNIMQ